MSKFNIRVDLTKQAILQQVSEVDIFLHYLSILEPTIRKQDILDCIEYSDLIKSPLRYDKTPTVGFKYTNRGKLRMRDFNGHFWGDAFDLVAYILRKDTSKAGDFKYILAHIANSMNIGESHNIYQEEIDIDAIKSRKTIIQISVRNWEKYDFAYWNQFCIDRKMLEYYNVFPVDMFWINKSIEPKPMYYHKRTDPCYAYFFGKDKNGIDNIQLYFPFRNKKDKLPRFIINFHSFLGLYQIYNKGDLLITKAYKDIISLSYFLNRHLKRKISIIAPPSESTPLTDKQANWLNKTYNNKYIFYDFDITGIEYYNKIKTKLNCKPIFLTNGRFGTVNYKAKDFTDYVKDNGEIKTFKLIKNFIENEQVE